MTHGKLKPDAVRQPRAKDLFNQPSPAPPPVCDKVPEMLRAVILGLMAAFAALSQTAPRSIGIFIQFEATPASQSVVVMKSEVARILKPAGFTINWRSLEENRGSEAFSDILVVKFHGKCRIQYGDPEGDLTDQEYTLATTLVNKGKV